MNRAATKLAALDATFGLTVTQNNKEFTFADICGGPGGFSGKFFLNKQKKKYAKCHLIRVFIMESA